jgi:hypothetical protein
MNLIGSWMILLIRSTNKMGNEGLSLNIIEFGGRLAETWMIRLGE